MFQKWLCQKEKNICVCVSWSPGYVVCTNYEVVVFLPQSGTNKALESVTIITCHFYLVLTLLLLSAVFWAYFDALTPLRSPLPSPPHHTALLHTAPGVIRPSGCCPIPAIFLLPACVLSSVCCPSSQYQHSFASSMTPLLYFSSVSPLSYHFSVMFVSRWPPVVVCLNTLGPSGTKLELLHEKYFKWQQQSYINYFNRTLLGLIQYLYDDHGTISPMYIEESEQKMKQEWTLLDTIVDVYGKLKKEWSLQKPLTSQSQEGKCSTYPTS